MPVFAGDFKDRASWLPAPGAQTAGRKAVTDTLVLQVLTGQFSSCTLSYKVL